MILVPGNRCKEDTAHGKGCQHGDTGDTLLSAFLERSDWGFASDAFLKKLADLRAKFALFLV